MKKSTVFLALVVALASPALQAQKKPAWADGLPNLPDRPAFYQGLGRATSTGDENADWQLAASRARSEVAAQIRVRITSAITSSIKESSVGVERQYAEAFASTTDQIAEATLEGLTVDRWYDEREHVWYGYAAIARKDVEAKFAEVFRNAVSSARVYASAAERALRDGDVFAAMGQYIEGIKTVFVAEAFLNRSVVGDLNGDGKDEPVLAYLQSQLCNLAAKTRFEILGGNQQQAEKGRSLPLALTGRIVYESPGGVLPVRNAVLRASIIPPARGTLTGEMRTDEAGVFSVAVNGVDGGEATNIVRVSLPLQGADRLARDTPAGNPCWKNLYVDFSFFMKVRANVTIAMHIVERNLGRLNTKSLVQQELQKQLIAGNYTIVEESKIYASSPAEKLNSALDAGNFDVVVHALSAMSDFVVVGTVITRERSNPTPQMFFCTGSVVLRVVDAKTGRIVATASLDNEKEGGSSYEVAGMKIIQRLGKQLADEIRSEIDRAMQ